MRAPRSWLQALLLACAGTLGCNDLLGVQELEYSGGDASAGCAASCPDDWAHAAPVCVNGACGHACDPTWGDCDNDGANGCEADLSNDGQHCGTCFTACASEVCRNSACLTEARYGNTGPGVGGVDFGGGFLAGIQVYVAEDCVLTRLGVVLYTAAPSCSMVLGLYRDEAGKPTTLLATVSQSFVAKAGGVEVELAPGSIELAAGNYWILGVWNDFANFATNGATVGWLSAKQDFGPLPSTAPVGMEAVSGLAPNLYVVVAQ